MGPDEFHEKYPGAAEGGLRNNAYTNVMVAWICATAPEVLDLLPERRREALRSRIGLTDDEVATWAEMSRKMFVPFHGDGIISQFEGYEELAELDWDALPRESTATIQRLDRILRAEGDDPDRYKLAKQADTVHALLPVLRARSSASSSSGSGTSYAPGRRAQEHRVLRRPHLPRLDAQLHHARRACSPTIDPESSWERFLVALESDIGDIQGGTTKEGIHMGVMSGTLDLVQRGYLGTAIRGRRPLLRADG